MRPGGFAGCGRPGQTFLRWTFHVANRWLNRQSEIVALRAVREKHVARQQHGAIWLHTNRVYVRAVLAGLDRIAAVWQALRLPDVRQSTVMGLESQVPMPLS